MDAHNSRVNESRPIKVAVFTALFGKVDKLTKFERIPGWDYHLFTDQSYTKDDTSFTHIHYIIPPASTQVYSNNASSASIYANRFFKWHSLDLLGGSYTVIIYVDAFQMVDATSEQKVRNWIEMATTVYNDSDRGLMMCKHPIDDCIYKELAHIVLAHKDVTRRMQIVNDFLRSQGFPANAGLLWNGCYIVNTSCPWVKDVWAKLWDHMRMFTYRDQSLHVFELWCAGALNKIFVTDLASNIIDLDTNSNHEYVG